jgi:23S rRNA (cytidine2498-2'-O)-methyltransferase
MPTEKPSQLEPSEFIFVCCQHGSEKALKSEIVEAHPGLNFAFSRPGFLTFKLTPEAKLPLKFSLTSTFARTSGWSFGKATGDDAATLIEGVIQSPAAAVCDHVHVWQRDTHVPGKKGFEPGQSVLADEVARLITASPPMADRKVSANQVAKANELILDVVMVEPNQWWFGFHYATTTSGRWPGGVPKIDASQEVISRAYFKLDEALRWSGIKITPGDVCAEIGSAPGGACQLLLEQGATVIGVDPAEMETEVLEHPNFTHIRRRGNEVRKKDLRSVRWLMADINAAPTYTLDTIEEMVTSASVDVTGVVLTLKLVDMKFADQISAFRARVKGFGFSLVKTRQLAFNRGEICLVGVKDRFALRSSHQRARSTKKSTALIKEQSE